MTVKLDKQFIVDELKKQGESTKAQKVLDAFPAKIDREEHAGLLMKLGVDPASSPRRQLRKGWPVFERRAHALQVKEHGWLDQSAYTGRYGEKAKVDTRCMRR
jgi:hypothetical protein